MRRSATIFEVGRHAGVSNATVSVVMSGSASNTRVSAETRVRVEQIARSLGYRPNAVARSLGRRSTNTIGLYCGYGYLDTSLPFYAELIAGLLHGCDERR